jgi:hypothetical protein
MFDKTTIDNSRTTFQSPETIEIKNAPTSDQIRLLREVERDLKKDLIGAFKIEDNKFRIMVLLDQNPMMETFTLIGKLTLNGEEIVVEEKFCRFDKKGVRDILQDFITKISKEVATHFVRGAIMADDRVFRTMAQLIGPTYRPNGKSL